MNRNHVPDDGLNAVRGAVIGIVLGGLLWAVAAIILT